jgi:hypothetical protein
MAMEMDLENMLDNAEAFCRKMYRKEKEIMPILHIVAPDQVPIVVEFGWQNEHERASKLAITRAFLRVSKASAYLLINETWFTNIKHDDAGNPLEPLPDQAGYVMPSQRVDRLEGLVLSAVTRDGTRQCRLFELKRDAAGFMSEMIPKTFPNEDFGGELLELFESDTAGSA